MPQKVSKYANPKAVVKGGFRRATKSELKALGYSPRSVLYTKAGVKNPKKFITRADIRAVQRPAQIAEIEATNIFSQLKRDRIKSSSRKLFRYTYSIYSDYLKPINAEQARGLIVKFFNYLQKRFNPHYKKNAVSVEVTAVDTKFYIGPVAWRDRAEILERLTRTLQEYKIDKKLTQTGLAIIQLIGHLEHGQ